MASLSPVKIGKPFDASYEHHGDEPVTLLDIVRTRLLATGVALLSACHMAELTDKDFVDTDGPEIARYLYKTTLSNGWNYYKRKALRALYIGYVMREG